MKFIQFTTYQDNETIHINMKHVHYIKATNIKDCMEFYFTENRYQRIKITKEELGVTLLNHMISNKIK